MIIYKTINLINGKIYIGKDKNNNDNYLGSGKALLRAIEKYGKENFKKEVIEECNSYEEMNEREIYWIDYHNAVESRKYYNMKSGGDGGDCPQTHTKEFIQKMKKVNNKNRMHGKRHKNKSKQLMKERAKGRYTLEWFIERYGEEGRQKYEERNKKLSEGRKGDKNPFYGKKFEYTKHPMYKQVNKKELLRLIKQELTLKEMGRYFDCSDYCISSKIKHYWNCSLKEFRKASTSTGKRRQMKRI